MKKGRRVHPCSPAIDEKSAAMPVAVAVLAAALPDEDREVLFYLLSCCSNSGVGVEEKENKIKKNKKHKKKTSATEAERTHVPQPGCACFSCYKSFWARWDASPNRHVIDKALEAFEESVITTEEDDKQKKRRRRRKKSGGSPVTEEEEFLKSDNINNGVNSNGTDDYDNYDSDYCDYDGDDDEGKSSSSSPSSPSSVRRLITFIGEKVLGEF